MEKTNKLERIENQITPIDIESYGSFFFCRRRRGVFFNSFGNLSALLCPVSPRHMNVCIHHI